MAEFKLKKGFDIKPAGTAEKTLRDLHVTKAALQPPDFRGIVAKLEVKVGDSVKKGTPLFHAKSNEEMKFVSPISGKVSEINRGARRALTEIVVESDNSDNAESFNAIDGAAISSTKKEDLIALMLQSGLWPMFRQRPFSKIANPNDAPRDIFISGMDTAPLAADVEFTLQGLEKEFQYGVDILNQLTEGKVYLSTAPGTTFFNNVKNVEKNLFSGAHPAGNVGVQMHHIKPVNSGEVVWYVQPYAVAMIGKTITSGTYAAERVVATAGSEIENRCYYKTVLGAPIAELITPESVNHPEVRYITGNMLTGRKVLSKGYAGFYDNLISVIAEGPKQKRLLGWYRPGFNLRSHSRSFLSTWVNRKENNMDTLYNGADRTFVMSGDYEKVLPMDIYPVYLIKSILAEDIEEMEQLGILEVDEEDVALCSYICPSKYDFGGLVRKGLDLIEKEG